MSTLVVPATAGFLLDQLADEDLVAEAVAAREEAEEVEAEAGSPYRWRVADSYVEMSRRGWMQERIASKCKVSQKTVSIYIAAAKLYTHGYKRPRFTDAENEIRGRTGKDLVASDENEWYTPVRYIEVARRVLGRIDLDPASSDLANQTVGAESYYTAAEDGLAHPWNGHIWLNPPYGGLAGDFAQRLIQEYEAGTVAAAILLVNAHCTDTEWFQSLWDYTLCFTDHRIDFDSAGREKDTSSTHGSVFVYLGDSQESFKHEFSEFGAVVRRA